MERQIVTTEGAPSGGSLYAQANRVGGLVFTSGQIPLDPKSGELVGTTFEEQAVQAIENLKAVLEAAGSGLGNVVKTTVFLSDIANFAALNEVYGRYFNGAELPSRSAFAVAALPKGALVEIEAIAF